MTDTHLGSRSQNRMSSFGNITQAALKASNQIKTGRKIRNVNTWNILKVVQGKLCVCDGLGKEGGKLTQALFTILWSTSCRWGESSGGNIFILTSCLNISRLRILWKKLKAVRYSEKLSWLFSFLTMEHKHKHGVFEHWNWVCPTPCVWKYIQKDKYLGLPLSRPQGWGLQSFL